MDPMNDTTHVSVLVVDDETLMRAGLRLLIDGIHGIEVVGEAANGVQAVELVADLNPDVVLMDVRMPMMDGLAATAELVAQGTRARIVVLTSFDTDDYLLRALHAGACSFLLKDAPPEEVVDAVLRAAHDEPRFSSGALRRLVGLAASGTASETPSMSVEEVRSSGGEQAEVMRDHITFAPETDTTAQGLRTTTEPGDLPVGITAREWDVARLVAQGLTNAEIAERLYLSLPTVKTHLGRLFDKMQVTNRVQLALRVIEVED